MKTSKFQLIVFIVLIICIIAGVIAFATYKGSGAKDQLPTITIWGTFPKSAFDQYVTQTNYTTVQQMTIMYVQESPDAFSRDFVEALARGMGPDAILIPADLLLASADKLTPIPYSVLPQRTFMNTYIDEAAVYLTQGGELGIPFVTDPLVMYWNRDLFNAAGLVMCADPSCAVYWDQISAFNQKLTEKQDNGTVTKSAVALGDFANVANAREIFGTLLLQSGNPITVQTSGGTVSSALKPSSSSNPVTAVSFFAQFVNPTSDNYSWNRSWPSSKTAFLAGNLATYFGLASELSDLRAKNPNLNFDIAPFPQLRSGGVKAAYAKMYGFSIVKSSQNANVAYQIISALTAPANLARISASLYLPSVSRAVIAAGSPDPYMTIFNQEALIAKTWLDVDPGVSEHIFGDMIQAVTSGQKSAIEAVNNADTQYNAVLQRSVVTPSALSEPSSLSAAAIASLSAAVPPVDINKPGFKLVICDGPEGAGHIDPATGNIDTTKDERGNYKYPLQSGYRVCDFNGLVDQAQYLINVMIVLGIVGAMISFAYAGFLYIKGDQSSRTKAKEMLPKMFIGLILMLTAWFIVSQILIWLTGTSTYLPTTPTS